MDCSHLVLITVDHCWSLLISVHTLCDECAYTVQQTNVNKEHGISKDVYSFPVLLCLLRVLLSTKMMERWKCFKSCTIMKLQHYQLRSKAIICYTIWNLNLKGLKNGEAHFASWIQGSIYESGVRYMFIPPGSYRAHLNH